MMQVSALKRVTAAFVGASIASMLGASCSSEPASSSVDAVQTGDCPEGGSSDAAGDAGSPCRSFSNLVAQGKTTFRFDTFGDESFWTDQLKLHTAIAGSAHDGGIGPGLSPKAALAVGLKVDADALPSALAQQIQAGQVNLDDPATTLALIDLNAIVGIKGKLSADKNSLASLGITCALCHSTVDNSFAPGIGKRLDGWPNRDLNVGAFISLAPDLSPFTTLLGVDDATVRTVLAAWGPGKFDAELILDGKGFRPDGKTAATLIPAAYGLAGVNLHTYTGWGSIPYWNAFVAILEMHGSGKFFDPRLDDATRFPIAARAKLGHVTSTSDLVTGKLDELHVYQLSLPAPKPAPSSFDGEAAARGQALFNGAAKCAQCHTPPTYTEPGWNMHTAEEIGIDDFQAQRSPDGRYRTTPLGGVASRSKGGFYHDGRFATFREVVDHYDTLQSLALTEAQKNDLVEFLKSL
jgi:hypothetical protein